jgi:hypothetical protein
LVIFGHSFGLNRAIHGVEKVLGMTLLLAPATLSFARD